MKNVLIFTQQNRLHRLFDIVITLLAWGMLGSLLIQGIFRLINNQSQGLPIEKILFYLAVALLVNIALLSWAKYNQRRFRHERRQRKPGLELSEVAKSLHISPREMERLNQSRIMVVHHCSGGVIQSVKVRQ